MKNMKHAIYFNGVFNPANPSNEAICLTYDEDEGIRFNHSGKNLKLVSEQDLQQNLTIKGLFDEIASLKKEIITIKANANGGIYETDEMITVTIINENIDDSTKDIEINSTENVVIKPTTINGKSVTISALTTDTSETNATLIIKATENVSAKNLTVKGSFSSNTNQVDIATSKKIVITDSIIAASGYNGLMIGQTDFSTLPDEILIENVNFTGEYELATINICATADNAKVIIRNCTFGKTGEPFRFRNATNAKGVNVLIENCHFDESIAEAGKLLILFEENGPVKIANGEIDNIWGFAKKIAEENGVVLENGETGGTPSYVKRVFPFLLAFEDSENRFGKDKFTFTFRNCTFGPEKTSIKFFSNEYKTVIGSESEVCIIEILRQSGRESFNAWNENWPKGKNFAFPYDDEVKYIGEYIEEIDWNQQNKNSDCYPEFIFE